MPKEISDGGWRGVALDEEPVLLTKKSQRRFHTFF